ncbi:MAG: NAD(P)-binding domain-containing protein [Alphaproteobacteria bacterium]|nr:NAD(P)-binding domain-containing protein [Alphaproteobacteria bacterium]
MTLADQRLGVIGVGNIAGALLTGLATGPRPPHAVLLSPRSAETSASLAARFPQMRVAADNQAVVDGSDVVMLAVRPQVAREVLTPLRFRPEQRILSLIAIHPLAKLAPLVAPATRMHRALPLPPVARRLGPIAISPPDPELESWFATVGTVVPVADDHHFEAIWSTSALIATFYALVSRAADWGVAQGLPRESAERYAKSVFHAVAQPLADPGAKPAELAALAQTKGGLNEQILRHMTEVGAFDEVARALDMVLARLEGR